MTHYKKSYLATNKSFIIYFFLLLFFLSCSEKTEITKNDISIIPYPKSVTYDFGFESFHKGQLTVSVPDEVSEIFPVIENDYYLLSGSNIKQAKKATLSFELNDNPENEEYMIDINKKKITIKGSTRKALLMGWASFLQLIQIHENKIRLPRCLIQDKPYLGYRGLLLDVARKFQSIESVKQIVDICRWYKINYIQLHLNDDQLFVFPSDAFPKLATKGKSYTKAELKDLVAYATQRGVTIIPELDAPGHTTTMRIAYPELFGESNLGMLDVANPDVLDACKTIIAEMMNIFHTSPYFHIGADEVWLGNFQQLESTKKAVKTNHFDTPHDLYLNYIIKMHEFVKSKGKQTLMWESFENNGSNKVKIPNDILVFAWETMYQRPDDLVKNGYTILNASWRPCYVTPQIRWTQSQIYHWNIWRWEHFLDFAPAWNPIQFEGDMKNTVIGAQLCAWEMTEEMNQPSITLRLPALSENGWNPNLQKDYAFFSERFKKSDDKLSQLLFPAKITKEGPTTGIKDERYHNRENYFSDKISVSIETTLPDISIRYTTDGTVPDIYSKPFTNPFTTDSSTNLRIGLFKNNRMIGYKSELLEKRPLVFSFTNTQNDPDSPIDRTECFTDFIQISHKLLIQDYIVRYTLDGSLPTTASPILPTEMNMNENVILKAQCFNKQGIKEGELYTFQLKKLKEKK